MLKPSKADPNHDDELKRFRKDPESFGAIIVDGHIGTAQDLREKHAADQARRQKEKGDK